VRDPLPPMLNMIRKRAYKVISLLFSKLYYACVIDIDMECVHKDAICAIAIILSLIYI